MTPLLTNVLMFIAGGISMTVLQQAIAPLYARQIHAGKCTLDDVKPQTKEYRAYVASVYEKIFHEKL